MGEIIDKVKEKVKDAKDTFVDSTKDVAEQTKETVDPSTSSSSSSYSSSNSDRKYEEGSAGTNFERKSDPLKEWESNEPMTPSKLNTGEPTAVTRDPSDQQITEPGKTGTDTPEAEEQYRKKGMTKIDSESNTT